MHENTLMTYYVIVGIDKPDIPFAEIYDDLKNIWYPSNGMFVEFAIHTELQALIHMGLLRVGGFPDGIERYSLVGDQKIE